MQKLILIIISCVLVIILSGKGHAFSEMGSLQSVVSRLEHVTGQKINIVIEDSSNPDAYLHPMGYVIITTGLLKFLEYDEAELAFVIGHEFAHFVKGHYKGETGVLGISREICFKDELLKEIEADAHGLKIIEAAGYDPAASFTVLNKLRSYGIGQLSPLERRINALLTNVSN